ncbi:hypothetical protein N7495_001699 [Penicillium taxi]|uniref:uncharacterized protein n=1 Tax=Penicillium taxi TaxID=168475 RepID=UPI0025457D5D|nr:uncharacterized protein N7495_001699 [Penicillium taxi]KAJ5909017.1 hypothetical protein N7495_001699 [Penicillium taxi]
MRLPTGYSFPSTYDFIILSGLEFLLVEHGFLVNLDEQEDSRRNLNVFGLLNDKEKSIEDESSPRNYAFDLLNDGEDEHDHAPEEEEPKLESESEAVPSHLPVAHCPLPIILEAS